MKMRVMVFKARLWYKIAGVLTFAWAIFMAWVLYTSWHIDNTSEWFWVLVMFIISFIAGGYISYSAYRYRLELSKKSIKSAKGFMKLKEIMIDDVQRVVIYKGKSKLKVISHNTEIIVDGTLRYYVTFLKALSHTVPNDKIFFVNYKPKESLE